VDQHPDHKFRRSQNAAMERHFFRVLSPHSMYFCGVLCSSLRNLIQSEYSQDMKSTPDSLCEELRILCQRPQTRFTGSILRD